MASVTTAGVSAVFGQIMPGMNVETLVHENTHEVEVRMKYGIIETIRAVEETEPQRQVEQLQGMARRIQERAFIDLGMEDTLREERRKQVQEDVTKLKYRIASLQEDARKTGIPGVRESIYQQMGVLSEAISILEKN
jgi:superfamily I DNA and RNA helicase